MYEGIIVLILLGFTAALLRVPILGSFLALFHTLVHENGHVAAAKWTGGKAHSVSLFYNQSGLALTSHQGKGGAVLTIAAGYVFASAVSVVYIYALMMQWYTPMMIVLCILLLYNIMFLVKNIVGILWLGSVFLLIGVLYANQAYEASVYVLYIIGSTLLVQAFLSSLYVWKMSRFHAAASGDAALLEKATGIPAVFWGFIFFGQGAVCFTAGTWMLVREGLPFL
ncbi:peptidase M50B-like protein [Sinobaca qinghaiensis]|uniref:Peptidase M50B-like protein n=1 Tax=Sinobaca qinghaiensis TaxID=342944 RepID=A0A419V6H5_9BACL|nr:M50 family metallopeptidase [Sinobaca qinghaiensis]RKD75548.1 peptidase M50B-like protein [Sinobaca qinghaiensis]